MNKKALIEALLDKGLLKHQETAETLISRLDGDYLKTYDLSQIMSHISMAQALTPTRPVAIKISDHLAGGHKIALVAYDYFSAFSVICGLLSSFGLNIEGGLVQTVAREKHRNKIIDLFLVSSIKKRSFDAKQQTQLITEIEVAFALLEKQHFREVRARVNARLVKYLHRMRNTIDAQETRIVSQDDTPSPSLTGLLRPISIHFDNTQSTRWTILTIEAQDTPAFLYAFSNALTMRNIYIHKIKIVHREGQIEDQLTISNRQGKKILKETQQQALKVTAVLIKQFVHFLPDAPDPVMAIHHFDQFLDKILETADARPLISFLKQKDTLALLARFFGTSNFLWEDFLRLRFDTLFPVLEATKDKNWETENASMRSRLQRQLQNISDFEDKKRIVNLFKDKEMFRIDLKHLHRKKDITHFSNALTHLADIILSASLRICATKLEAHHGIPRLSNKRRAPFALFGLGKCGGNELGYASDIELLFVYDGEGQTDGENPLENSLFFDKLTQSIVAFVEARQAGIFQIDTRLRPYGSSGRPAISLHQFQTYYSEQGKSAQFERQALIKLRYISGHNKLGKEVEAARDLFVYGGPPLHLGEALELRKRQVSELVEKGHINVKYSDGGLVDIEYFVQHLQIRYGGDATLLRNTNTLLALKALQKQGRISKTSSQALQEAYIFLRMLIDALRMVRGNARDLLLPDETSEAFTFLARRMSTASRDGKRGRKQLSATISKHMAEAKKHQNMLFQQESSPNI